MLEKDNIACPIKEAFSSQTASGGARGEPPTPRRPLRRRSNRVVKVAIAERSLLLFSLNDTR